MLTVQNNSLISFGMKTGGAGYYSGCYAQNKNHNGKAPDKYLMECVQTKQPEVVIDLGAGQGRNSLPMAENRKIYAFEINKRGRKTIQEEIEKRGISNYIISKQNIVDGLNLPEKADFAFMSHISQHFNAEELGQVFKNVAESVKNGGEFVFDALVRTSDKYKKYDKLPLVFKYNYQDIEDYGAASFRREDIQTAAKQAGLEIVEEIPFWEKSLKRVPYETQNLWGGRRFVDFLFGVPRKPVKLTWFVLKK